MSLPPALAARLAKRGLINQKSTNQQNETETVVEHEEVIAEDYTDDTPKQEIFTKAKTIETFPGCPNKYNIHHNCTNYCAKRYADYCEDPPKNVKKLFVRLLKKYPIKDPVWEQVYDPGLKTYYFWNTDTDQVSWLPPNHPDAKISISAEKLRQLIRDDKNDESTSDKEELPDDNDDNKKDEDLSNDESDDDDDSDESEDSSDSSESEDNLKFKMPIRAIAKRNQLDPMDPASYSDIPRGKWSDGLNNKER